MPRPAAALRVEGRLRMVSKPLHGSGGAPEDGEASSSASASSPGEGVGKDEVAIQSPTPRVSDRSSLASLLSRSPKMPMDGSELIWRAAGGSHDDKGRAQRPHIALQQRVELVMRRGRHLEQPEIQASVDEEVEACARKEEDIG